MRKKLKKTYKALRSYYFSVLYKKIHLKGEFRPKFKSLKKPRLKTKSYKVYSIKNCQICEVELVNGKLGGNSRAIDHSHISGKVRGVLCANCNKAEGYISNITENPIMWADKLRHYLESSISNER